jgi:hypothetical protein
VQPVPQHERARSLRRKRKTVAPKFRAGLNWLVFAQYVIDSALGPGAQRASGEWLSGALHLGLRDAKLMQLVGKDLAGMDRGTGHLSPPNGSQRSPRSKGRSRPWASRKSRARTGASQTQRDSRPKTAALPRRPRSFAGAGLSSDSARRTFRIATPPRRGWRGAPSVHRAPARSRAAAARDGRSGPRPEPTRASGLQGLRRSAPQQP